MSKKLVSSFLGRRLWFIKKIGSIRTQRPSWGDDLIDWANGRIL